MNKNNTQHFIGKFVYPTWFNDKKYKFYLSMIERLEKYVWVHLKSARYFDSLNFRLFAPSITLTAVSGIAGFLATSTYISEDVQVGFNITVGVLSSISTMMQSIVSAMKYSAKADSHRLAADEYNSLLTRIKFEIEMPNEENFGETMEKKILEIQSKCKYFPPQHIIDSYKPKPCKQEEQMFKGTLNKHNNDSNPNESTHLLENVVIAINEEPYTSTTQKRTQSNI